MEGNKVYTKARDLAEIIKSYLSSESPNLVNINMTKLRLRELKDLLPQLSPEEKEQLKYLLPNLQLREGESLEDLLRRLEAQLQSL